jgi:hypothetical protein
MLKFSFFYNFVYNQIWLSISGLGFRVHGPGLNPKPIYNQIWLSISGLGFRVHGPGLNPKPVYNQIWLSISGFDNRPALVVGTSHMLEFCMDCTMRTVGHQVFSGLAYVHRVCMNLHEFLPARACCFLRGFVM